MEFPTVSTDYPTRLTEMPARTVALPAAADPDIIPALTAPDPAGDRAFGRRLALSEGIDVRQRRKKPMTKALAMSMKKADTSGRIMNAIGAAPCTLVTAVMLAIAVGVAPRLMPLKPAEITAAS
jgi:hypothetical protein